MSTEAKLGMVLGLILVVVMAVTHAGSSGKRIQDQPITAGNSPRLSIVAK